MNSLLSRTRGLGSLAFSNNILDNIKNVIVLYFLLNRILKVHRHIRARGLLQTLHDFYTWVLQESMLLALRIPSAHKKVETELGKARLQIEERMIPKAPE
ncbi:hypothetical protein A0H81_09249 [Grifola frondosa]|uniref:Uncharacterized protein n=1 Tax=Grifola frondosa TaxID=5627 RepID=A0A1C7M1J4_GRIFR|nr:hypothetical protein A0H81_09249 [Grifola frondosa]